MRNIFITILLNALICSSASCALKTMVKGPNPCCDNNWFVDSNWYPEGVPTYLDIVLLTFVNSNGTPYGIVFEPLNPYGAGGLIIGDNKVNNSYGAQCQSMIVSGYVQMQGITVAGKTGGLTVGDGGTLNNTYIDIYGGTYEDPSFYMLDGNLNWCSLVLHPNSFVSLESSDLISYLALFCCNFLTNWVAFSTFSGKSILPSYL